MNNDLAVIILATDVTKGLKSYHNKGGFKNKENILSTTLSLIRHSFPQAEILLATRPNSIFEHCVPFSINYIEIEDYGCGYTLGHTLALTSRRSILVTYGNLIFNQEALTAFEKQERSAILFDINRKVEKSHSSGIIENERVRSMSCGLEARNNKIVAWGQMTYYTRGEAKLLRRLCLMDMYHRYDEPEFINDIIDLGGTFDAIISDDVKLLTLNKPIDIKKIKSIL